MTPDSWAHHQSSLVSTQVWSRTVFGHVGRFSLFVFRFLLFQPVLSDLEDQTLHHHRSHQKLEQVLKKTVAPKKLEDSRCATTRKSLRDEPSGDACGWTSSFSCLQSSIWSFSKHLLSRPLICFSTIIIQQFVRNRTKMIISKWDWGAPVSC